MNRGLLFATLKELIREQSEGEWDDRMIAKDARIFTERLAPLFALAKADQIIALSGGGEGAVADPLADAREAFLNMVADAKKWEFEYDGDETGCWATVTMVSDHGQVQELCDALGMIGPYDEGLDERIARYVEMPATPLDDRAAGYERPRANETQPPIDTTARDADQ
jgi:hypothetical protein